MAKRLRKLGHSFLQAVSAGRCGARPWGFHLWVSDESGVAVLRVGIGRVRHRCTVGNWYLVLDTGGYLIDADVGGYLIWP